MKKIISKPHLFFFGLVPLFIILALISRDKTIDISVHDTYFVISNYHICLFSAIFYAMIGINYFSLQWSNKPPKKWLTIVHLSLQTISLIPFLYSLLNSNSNGNFSTNNSIGFAELHMILVISFLIFILSLLIHLINFFTSLFSKTD